jgi:hypothetical protein
LPPVPAVEPSSCVRAYSHVYKHTNTAGTAAGRWRKSSNRKSA